MAGIAQLLDGLPDMKPRHLAAFLLAPRDGQETALSWALGRQVQAPELVIYRCACATRLRNEANR